MPHTIEKIELAEQSALVANRRLTRAEISAAIGEILPKVFHYAQQHGISPTSPPITRYLEMDGEQMTIQPGVCVSAGPPEGASADGDAEEIHWDTLPGGTAVKALHRGPYDELHEVYRAIEAWMAEHGLAPAGAPWEVYLTDPGQVADPTEWKTEIYWPAR